MDITIGFVSSSLERAQAEDLRRSVLCGELHWPREVVEEKGDSAAQLALVCLGPKAIATGRLIQREGFWHLELLAVLERFRKQGVGKRLVEALEERALQQGATRLRVLATEELCAYFGKMGYLPLDGPMLEKLIKLSDGEALPKAL